MLNEENVKEYIIPKMDFNSTNPEIITNLKNAPFTNENIIMDLVKNGEITEELISDYFIIKRKYSSYISIRIPCYDAPHTYEKLRIDLLEFIDLEIKKLNVLKENKKME